MEKQHPLKFFVDFVELKPLKAWEEEFYEGAIPEYDSLECRKQGYIIDLKATADGGQSEFKLYLKDVLASRFLEQKSLAIQSIENELMSMSDMNGMKVKLTVLSASIASLTDKLMAYKGVIRFPFILETYTQLQQEFDNKGLQMGLGSKHALKQTDKSDSVSKLQWLGQLNVLGTLFYDLCKGQDGGLPYISGTLEDVKKMLAINFVDKDGHELSKTTLDTYFIPGKPAKRANIGDRIELPNKKPKR